MTRYTKAERENSLETLREMIPAGSTVYTVLKHVSRSGMSRRIQVLIATDADIIRNISWLTARVLDLKQHDDGSLIVGGYGMDMGFHAVYSLSRALWPNGHDCDGKRCNSNDHRNGEKNTHHADGGYCLRQEWL